MKDEQLGAFRIWISKNNINNQVIQFVPFWSPSSTSLNFSKGHLTIPKRAPAELPGICGIYKTAKVEWCGYFSTFLLMANSCLKLWTNTVSWNAATPTITNWPRWPRQNLGPME